MYLLVIVALLLSLLASAYVRIAFNRFDKEEVKCGLTTNQFVDMIFKANDIYDVSIGSRAGSLTDAYSDKDKTLFLSSSTIGSRSISAIGVAAHEAGHAIQYKEGYFPVHLRSQMVPIVNIGSNAGIFLAMAGGFINSNTGDQLINFGILLYSLVFLFTVVTLPVEFNASHRAIATVRSSGYFTKEEIKGMKTVLTAAALTYVASMVSALINLLRFIAIFKGNRSSRR